MALKSKPRSNAVARQTACILVTKREPAGITRGGKEAKNRARHTDSSLAGGCADLQKKNPNLFHGDQQRKTQAYLVGATPEAINKLRHQQEKQPSFSQSRHWHRTEVGSPEQKAVLEQIHLGLEAVGDKLGLLEVLQKKVDELHVALTRSVRSNAADSGLAQLDRIEQKLDAVEHRLDRLETVRRENLDAPEKKAPGREALNERLAQLDRIEHKLDVTENELAQLRTTIVRELKRPEADRKLRGELEAAGIEAEKRKARSGGLMGWLMGQDRTGD